MRFAPEPLPHREFPANKITLTAAKLIFADTMPPWKIPVIWRRDLTGISKYWNASPVSIWHLDYF
jgi:hypothetical protein